MGEKQTTIQYLTQVKRELTAERERLIRVEKQLLSVSETLDLLLHKEEKGAPLGFEIRQLHGLTQVQALVRIAKSNGGTLKLRDGKNLLISAGLVQDTKKASQRIHGAVTRSGVFEKIARGEYRLRQNGTLSKNNGLRTSGLADTLDAQSINPKLV